MKLGMVTYMTGAEWSVDEIISGCTAHGFEGVELRTTHAHGVEPSMSAGRRREIRAKFADSAVVLWGLGTTCEFHAVDQAEVRRNIDEAREFVLLARDVGATGIKVRPNGLQEEAGVPRQQTLEQIGRAYAEVGAAAKEEGVEVWMEVHGKDTSMPQNMRVVMDNCDSENCFLCWNSNPTDVDENGSIDANCALLQKWIRSCHITELVNPDYPYRRLFELLRASGYGDRFTLAEIQASGDPERFLPYYRALWEELSRAP